MDWRAAVLERIREAAEAELRATNQQHPPKVLIVFVNFKKGTTEVHGEVLVRRDTGYLFDRRER